MSQQLVQIHQIQRREKSVNKNRNTRQPDEVLRAEYSAKCQNCGACCSYYAYHTEGLGMPVDGELEGDLRYTFKFPQSWRTKLENGEIKEWKYDYFLKSKEEDGWKKCIALEGNVGQNVTCTVYQKRPSACNGFDPGSEMCIYVRKWCKIDV